MTYENHYEPTNTGFPPLDVRVAREALALARQGDAAIAQRDRFARTSLTPVQISLYREAIRRYEHTGDAARLEEDVWRATHA